MSTFMAKPAELERKWYIIDAAGKPLGRVASAAASILRGKNKPTFTPHVDCGDFVIILNAEKAVLTGKKLEQKYYRHHSGYVGGLKEVQYKILMEKNPEKAMMLAMTPIASTAMRIIHPHLRFGEEEDSPMTRISVSCMSYLLDFIFLFDKFF